MMKKIGLPVCRAVPPVNQSEIRALETENGVIYECPQKSTVKNTVCDTCVCRRMSNYEITKRKMAQSFARYDHEEMARKFHLTGGSGYLYIRFLNRPCRISRTEGTVTWSEDGFVSETEAGFNEAMTLYDVLYSAKEGCTASGEFVSVNHLVNAANQPGKNGMFTQKQAELFDHREAELSQACERLGGVKYGKGDVAYRLPLFDFLPVVVQFWNSDDEFPASLQLLWDKNILDFMHFETVWYAAGYLLDRLQELAEETG